MNHHKLFNGLALIIFLVLMVMIYPTVSITLTDSPCMPDCTTTDNVCHAECDGINGCVYPDRSILSANRLTVKEACDLQKKGWVKHFNGTYDVICCDSEPNRKLEQRVFSIEYGEDISEISTLSRTVNLNGEMVTMYLSLWNKRE